MQRFNSIGASNAANYAAAGSNVANSHIKAFVAQRKAAPDYTGLIKTAQSARAAVTAAGIEGAAKVARAGIQATSAAATGKARAKIIETKGDAQVKKTRMAGLLAAGKALGSVFEKDPMRPPPRLQVAPVKPATIDKNSFTVDRPTAPKVPTLEPIPSGVPGNSASPASTSTSTNLTPTSFVKGSGLTGNLKVLADGIAGPESGRWGYDAFNQGGAKGGTEVLGLSGSHAEHFGKPLTSMTVGQVLQRQSGYNDYSISDQQWRDNGGLWAVGRYQFIGPTLKDEVARMGLSMDTPFNEATQDSIFLSHAKRVGNISPWIGPSTKYSPQKKAMLNSIIQGL